MKKIALALLACLAGCASTPEPVQYQFDNSQRFDASMDDVWEIAVEFFAENHLPITRIERDSGLIVSNDVRFSDADFNLIADCRFPNGRRAEADSNGLRLDNGTGDLNLLIRERSTDNVEVLVNTRFDLFRDVPPINWGFIQSPGAQASLQCVSKGVYENFIFDRIATGINLPAVNFD